VYAAAFELSAAWNNGQQPKILAVIGVTSVVAEPTLLSIG